MADVCFICTEDGHSLIEKVLGKCSECNIVIKISVHAECSMVERFDAMVLSEFTDHAGDLLCKPCRAAWTCSICTSAVPEDNNEILQCEECRVCVHRCCYGVTEDVNGVKSWLCDVCASEAGVHVECMVCPATQGAIKRVQKHGLKFPKDTGWVHVCCVQWIPELFFEDPVLMTGVSGLDQIPLRRNQMKCFLCKHKGGACIECTYGNCRQAFHPACGVQAILRRIADGIPQLCDRDTAPSMMICDVEGEDYCMKSAFCPKHKEKARVWVQRSPIKKSKPSNKSMLHPTSKVLKAWNKFVSIAADQLEFKKPNEASDYFACADRMHRIILSQLEQQQTRAASGTGIRPTLKPSIGKQQVNVNPKRQLEFQQTKSLQDRGMPCKRPRNQAETPTELVHVHGESGQDSDAVCSACLESDAYPDNELLFCDHCNVCVHQQCYGVVHIPQDSWYCDKCNAGQRNSSCVLCPEKHGAMKLCNDGESWAHLCCIAWVPGASVNNTNELLPSVEEVKFEQHNCILCHSSCGVCVKCAAPRCSQYFHVGCAFWKWAILGESRAPIKVAHDECSQHSFIVEDLFCPQHVKNFENRVAKIREHYRTHHDRGSFERYYPQDDRPSAHMEQQRRPVELTARDSCATFRGSSSRSGNKSWSAGLKLRAREFSNC